MGSSSALAAAVLGWPLKCPPRVPSQRPRPQVPPSEGACDAAPDPIAVPVRHLGSGALGGHSSAVLGWPRSRVPRWEGSSPHCIRCGAGRALEGPLRCPCTLTNLPWQWGTCHQPSHWPPGDLPPQWGTWVMPHCEGTQGVSQKDAQCHRSASEMPSNVYVPPKCLPCAIQVPSHVSVPSKCHRSAIQVPSHVYVPSK